MAREKNTLIKDINERLLEIKEFIKNKTFEDFKTNKMFKRAVLYNLIILGEICNTLRKNHEFENNDLMFFLKKNRNILTHQYWISKDKKQWNLLVESVPKLEKEFGGKKIK